MLLVCGGLSRAHDQDHTEDVPLYPTVIAVLDEDAEDHKEKLEIILTTIIDPFVIRLLDKNFLDIVHSPLGKRLRNSDL